MGAQTILGVEDEMSFVLHSWMSEEIPERWSGGNWMKNILDLKK